ncbi:MAG: tRNA (adenosine(37)-N6)-threonylcarbamoyltransferase complex ATPase subunit type 1 TsaE [Deltaproteobacteria bacterium]|nr:tRNA (adenosine(37)-N6)-threonylcarbamoyltransferase complex ATPase subunit type 1 TsaE [Deltaproteobacteria bacterium]
MHRIEVITNGPDETFALAKRLGQLIDSKTTIALSGDLGAGKTVFVQGLADGLDVPEGCYVTSPTYTIVNEYPARIPLFHIDLYRISSSDELESAGIHEILDGKGVIAVEWAERAGTDVLPADIAVSITIMDDTRRNIAFFFYGPQAQYLIQGLDPDNKNDIHMEQ